MTVPEDDFATLFEASHQARQYERGQTIEGKIVAIGPAVAFVDVGGKGEAVLDIAELKNDEGVIEVAVGERIQAVVVSTSGGLTLSRKLVRGAAHRFLFVLYIALRQLLLRLGILIRPCLLYTSPSPRD